MKADVMVLVVLGLAGSLGTAGCAYHNRATGAEATYAFHALYSEVDAPLPVVYTAALKAADDLDLTVGRAVEGAFGAQVRAVDDLGNVVTIHLKPLAREQTGLRINLGLSGSRWKSIRVFNSIMANLAESRPTVAASTTQADGPE